MNRYHALSAVLSLLLLAVPNIVAPVAASPYTGGTDGWTMVGQPTVAPLNGYPTAKVIYHSAVNVTIPLAVVYVVVHNSAGQTVFINVATVGPVATNTNATAYDVIFGLPSGSYTASFFASLPSGTAMSVPTSVSITL